MQEEMVFCRKYLIQIFFQVLEAFSFHDVESRYSVGLFEPERAGVAKAHAQIHTIKQKKIKWC